MRPTLTRWGFFVPMSGKLGMGEGCTLARIGASRASVR